MSAVGQDALGVLRRVARETATARRLQGHTELALLQSVVDAAVTLFEAEAASIALFEPDPDRLEFRVASGARGAGVIGLSIATDQGIAGHVFSTREPITVRDLASEARFDAATARQTGYVPTSIAAVPLVHEDLSVGVLQVLDKDSADGFSARDMALLEVFARQAAAAVEAAQIGRDPVRLWRVVLASVGGDRLDAASLDALMEATATELEDDGGPYWELVDLVARERAASDADLTLVREVLDAVVRHHPRVPLGDHATDPT